MGTLKTPRERKTLWQWTSSGCFGSIFLYFSPVSGGGGWLSDSLGILPKKQASNCCTCTKKQSYFHIILKQITTLHIIYIYIYIYTYIYIYIYRCADYNNKNYPSSWYTNLIDVFNKNPSREKKPLSLICTMILKQSRQPVYHSNHPGYKQNKNKWVFHYVKYNNWLWTRSIYIVVSGSKNNWWSLPTMALSLDSHSFYLCWTCHVLARASVCVRFRKVTWGVKKFPQWHYFIYTGLE